MSTTYSSDMFKIQKVPLQYIKELQAYQGRIIDRRINIGYNSTSLWQIEILKQKYQ